MLFAIAATHVGTIEMKATSDLEQVRAQINKFVDESKDLPKLSDWCFVDCKTFSVVIRSTSHESSILACTAERFFRVDKAQENLHYVGDICCDFLYILECGGGTVPQTPDDDTTSASPSSNNQAAYIIPEMRIR